MNNDLPAEHASIGPTVRVVRCVECGKPLSASDDIVLPSDHGVAEAFHLQCIPDALAREAQRLGLL